MEHLYSVSYLWYSLIALLIVVVVGLIVSFITGRCHLKRKKYPYSNLKLILSKQNTIVIYSTLSHVLL